MRMCETGGYSTAHHSTAQHNSSQHHPGGSSSSLLWIHAITFILGSRVKVASQCGPLVSQMWYLRSILTPPPPHPTPHSNCFEPQPPFLVSDQDVSPYGCRSRLFCRAWKVIREGLETTAHHRTARHTTAQHSTTPLDMPLAGIVECSWQLFPFGVIDRRLVVSNSVLLH